MNYAPRFTFNTLVQVDEKRVHTFNAIGATHIQISNGNVFEVAQNAYFNPDSGTVIIPVYIYADSNRIEAISLHSSEWFGIETKEN